MAKIVTTKKTTIATINEGLIEQEHRPYLGMSQLGHSCERYLWYSFRWCYTSFITPRINRLLDRGHLEEKRFINYLEMKGIHTHSTQLEMTDVHEHCKGHNDGICEGVIEAPKTPHLAEFKTMSDKYFKEVKKNGVKAAKPIYYAQCQVYMHHLNLTRALFVAVNKNDDDWYIERVYYDKDTAIKLLRRGESIILSEAPPKKRFKPTWYECRYCGAKGVCHGNERWDRNCRTCISGDLIPHGKWECNRLDIELSTQQQRLGCKHYSPLCEEPEQN